MTQERRSLKLNNEEWQELERLAEVTQSIPARVQKEYQGQPSWRNLIKRIAQGDFVLIPNEEQLETN